MFVCVECKEMAAPWCSRWALGNFIVVIGVLVLTPDSLLIRLASKHADTGQQKWTVVFWRYLFYGCSLVVGLVAVHGRGLTCVLRRWFGWIGVAGAVAFATCNLCFTRSIQMTAAANTLVIVAASPMMTACLVRVFLKERIPWRTVAAIVAAFASVLLVLVGEINAEEADKDDVTASSTLLLNLREGVPLRLCHARAVQQRF